MASREAAGPSAAAPDEAPIAWPDHPLAASGGEILATRILPLMGHNARDFARAAAVCHGWRAACRAAITTLSLYRETALLQPGAAAALDDDDLYIHPGIPVDREAPVDFLAWSPSGKFIVSAVRRPPRLFIWRASTGALVNEWALATPATAVSQGLLENSVYDLGNSVAFSRDSTRVLTIVDQSNRFAVWSVPDGQLLVVHKGDPHGKVYQCADFGAPGSASDGLIGFCSSDCTIDLWDISPPTEGGGGNRPRLRSRVDIKTDEYDDGLIFRGSFKFSPDGSKFVTTSEGEIYVYDCGSLTRLGAYTFERLTASAACQWAPDGRHVLVTSEQSAFVWDSSRPEAPSVVTVDLGAETCEPNWSPSGASCLVYYQTLKQGGPMGRLGIGPSAYVLEERRAADGSLLRVVSLGLISGLLDFPSILRSPDSHALLLHPSYGSGGVLPAPRIVVFD